MYKSVDGGSNWTKMGFEKSERIANIIVNPKNSKEIPVGVLGALWGDSDERGVYKLPDGGATWNKVPIRKCKNGMCRSGHGPKRSNALYSNTYFYLLHTST